MVTWGKAMGIVAVFGLVACGPEAESARPEPLAEHSLCGDRVDVFNDTDEQMTEIAAKLTGDKRARKLYTETKLEAYERFKRIFEKQPDLVKLARPEALPATVTVVPAAGVDTKKLAEELRAEFPSVKEIKPFIREEVLKGATDAPECPPSGEFPPTK